MPAKLFCRTGDLSGTGHVIRDEATIGRGSGNSIVVPRKVVSDRHARIHLDRASDRFVVEDLGSRNGTRIDGRRIHGAEPLDDLNVLTLADRYDFVFQVVGAGDTTAAAPAGAATQVGGTPASAPGFVPVPGPSTQVPGAPPASPPPGVAAPPSPRGASPSCRVRSRGGDPRSHELDVGRTVVGRATDCDIRVDDPTVEPHHVALVVEAERTLLEPMDPDARTTVDGRPIDAPTPIRSGATIVLGESTTLDLDLGGAP